MSVVTVIVPASSVTATLAVSSDPSALSPGTLVGIIIGSLLGAVFVIAISVFVFIRHSRYKFTRVANPTHDDTHLQYKPLTSPLSWRSPPSTSRVVSLDTPRLGFIPGGGQHSSFDLGNVNLKIPSGSISRETTQVRRPSPESPHPDLENNIWHASGDGVLPSSPTPAGTSFTHRTSKSRIQASEGTSFAPRLSLNLSQHHSMTLDLSDVGASADDAETGQKREEEMGKEAVETASLRRKQHAPVPTLELPPVADTPLTSNRHSMSSPISTVGSWSLVSHGTASRRMSMAVEQSGTLPLLTSVNFGKDSASAHLGSVSSTTGWESSSAGRTSRYPSLAPSSIEPRSRSGPRSDADTDWHHLPSGLAGLTSLQNSHSLVEEKPAHPAVLVPGLPARRARLREGTTSWTPEVVERRGAMQGGIASIDIVL